MTMQFPQTHFTSQPSTARASSSRRSKRILAIGAGVTAALAASAYANYRLAKKAEREHPPIGRFVDLDGLKLHYFERGTGTPLVLLHGNGTMIQDFLSSGLIDKAAERYRVIAFDRPGYGYSERPRDRVWTAEAQADHLAAALGQLGAVGAIVLGHSWGCSVAVALAYRYPALVSGLVLESGYYYPSVRMDIGPASVPAVPVLGDVLRYTVSPPLSRLLWPLVMRKLFGPERQPQKFEGFPKAMAVRPSQIRAGAEEAALMIPEAVAARHRYGELKMPVAIIAGGADRMVTTEDQSARLHEEIPQSSFECVPGAGHMVHQTATGAVLAGIERVGALAA